MSTKNSIFLTEDNEHCYTECLEPIFNDGNYKGDLLCFEIDKKNYTHIIDSSGDMTIYFNNPESEIYQLILMLKDKEEWLR